YFHRDHSKLSLKENREEILNSVNFIEAACGTKVQLFAPPSGAYNDDTIAAAEELGLKSIMWSKDTIDWRDKDENIAFRKATQEVKGGDLILMHPMEHTLAALPKILQHYRDNGLRAICVGDNIG
ncbi:MAG: polysaccharide deacetylase family protein, partial [Clostridiales bacterium]|nr:polysaccharide deacetylase family protein [Clostridiales bacterium]